MKITESTLLPISLVIVIIAAAFWLAGMSEKVEAHDKRLDQQDETIATIRTGDDSFKSEVIDRLARIETEVKQIKK